MKYIQKSMIPTGIWAFNTFADACDFNWDICVEPGGTQKATHFFSNALVVNAASDKMIFSRFPFLRAILNSLNGQYRTGYNILMAGSLLSMIPIIIIYTLAQKYFKEGLMAGGVKG
mgnify:CR=1 FL=1